MSIPKFLVDKCNHIINGAVFSASTMALVSIASMIFFPDKLSPNHLLIPITVGLGIAAIMAIIELFKDGNDSDATAIILGASIPAVPMFVSSIPYLTGT